METDWTESIAIISAHKRKYFAHYQNGNALFGQMRLHQIRKAKSRWQQTHGNNDRVRAGGKAGGSTTLRNNTLSRYAKKDSRNWTKTRRFLHAKSQIVRMALTSRQTSPLKTRVFCAGETTALAYARPVLSNSDCALTH
jgi:hypothetical protein